jgi:type II secretory pathway component PulK
MNTQTEAERLADAIDPLKRQSLDNLTCSVAAAELRRLHEANQELVNALQPFVLANSSDEHINLMVRTVDVTKARAAIAKATGDQA